MMFTIRYVCAGCDSKWIKDWYVDLRMGKIDASKTVTFMEGKIITVPAFASPCCRENE